MTINEVTTFPKQLQGLTSFLETLISVFTQTG